MNYCWLALKLVQLVLSLLIATLFLVPQTLVVNDDALINPGKTNLTKVSTKVKPKHLWCDLIDYDFYDAQPEWLGIKPNVEFPLDIERQKKQSLDQIRRTLGCLQFWNGTKSDCLCWGSYYVIAIVGIAGFTVVFTVCDIVAIYAADGQDEKTQGSQGIGSCACSIITGVIWVAAGGVLVYYTCFIWPYSYHDFDDDDDKRFFNIPKAWQVGMFCCFSFAIIMVMEGVVYMGKTGREIVVPISDAMQHNNNN